MTAKDKVLRKQLSSCPLLQLVHLHDGCTLCSAVFLEMHLFNVLDLARRLPFVGGGGSPNSEAVRDNSVIPIATMN